MNIARKPSVPAMLAWLVLFGILTGVPQIGNSADSRQVEATGSERLHSLMDQDAYLLANAGSFTSERSTGPALAAATHELKPKGAVPAPAPVSQPADTAGFVKEGVVTYPQPGASLQAFRPVIGADYRAVKDRDPSLKPLLLLDGNDVTPQSDINADYVFYTPAADLSQGRHEAMIKMLDPKGEGYVIANWNFYVAGSRPLQYAYPPVGATITRARPVVGLRLSELPADLNIKTLRLIVDGKDVTSRCDITDAYIFYAPDQDLALGTHTVAVKAEYERNSRQETIAWDFTVGKPTGETAYATLDQGAAPDKKAVATAIARTQRRINSIARATHAAEWILGGPPPETAPTAVGQGADRATGPDRMAPDLESTPEPEQESAFEPGFEYAYNTMYGIENMAVDGIQELSSQRPRYALLYRLGLRTQTNLNSRPGRGWFTYPQFSINTRLEGTTDGDETESRAMLKSFTAVLNDETKRLSMYDINPKYTAYSLTGQRLYGAEFKATLSENTSYHLFGGKFKNPRAGKNIRIYGARFESTTPSGMQYGIHFVATTMRRVRGGDDSSSGLLGFDLSKKYAYGENKFEWAQSRYTDLADATAYRLENTWRKNKTYLSSRYENVGDSFRTEGGFASKGLVEFNTSMQYKNSSKLTSVLGFRRRTFRDGGSHTMSVPVVLKYAPFSDKPSTALEYRYKLTYYDKGDAWKDTYSNALDARHTFGSVKTQMSFSKERKDRNLQDQEFERVLNLNMRTPVADKTEFNYTLTKVNNNFFGPESKNVFSLTYEISDWSDMRVALERINKVQPNLDRTTSKLRWGKVNPDTNTEMTFEMLNNNFLLYDETYFTFKYSVFY